MEASGLLIRRLRPEDIPLAMRLKEAAGWNQTEQDWLNLIELEPEGCFALETGGVLASTATVVCYGNELAWIGMVLTAPEYRGRGFARRLM
ncbi:MAG: GNAT family N-acetyltransferase, partial [Bryobacteraceae bacterium]